MLQDRKYLLTNNWLSKPRIICGIMSGTSVDGVDTALVKFWKVKNDFKCDVLASKTYKFNKSLRNHINDVITNKVYISFVTKLNEEISISYINSIQKLIDENNYNIPDIDLIGVHGQTVWHNPNGKFPNTMQLVNANLITHRFNVPVVFDFRSSDVAVGGQGAPLVPIFDKHFISCKKENIVTLNIGGISNITYLPKDNSSIIAFDTGPGNILIDLTARKYFNKNYDRNGNLAKKGNCNKKLLDVLIKDTFINKPPPKSTGREYYNQDFIDKKIKDAKIEINAFDLIHTLTKFTVISILKNIKLFANGASKIIVSGGGVKNKFMMNMMKNEFNNINIFKSDDFGIKSDFKEAIAFAFLAYLNISQIPGNIPSVTGARKEVILGNLSLPF